MYCLREQGDGGREKGWEGESKGRGGSDGASQTESFSGRRERWGREG